VINIDNNLYNVYVNGTILSRCENKKVHKDLTPFKIYRVNFGIGVDTLESERIYVDNVLLVWNGANTSLADTGEPCTDGIQCASGYCEYGSCVLKQRGYPCTSSTQCASGDCKNGLCTHPTLSKNLNLAIKENFGYDPMTLNLISVFLMTGVPGVIVIMSGGGALGILLSIGIFIVEGFLFTVMGWLSPFILIGVIVFALIIVVFAFMIKGGG
jgi:hypothetical protein